MLARFKVENFKAFEGPIEFNLMKSSNYEFNQSAISEHNVINKAIIYGFNGCGKSVLGLALFDIVSHLTDKESGPSDYEPYCNLNNKRGNPASFEYEFIIADSTVVYKYNKTNLETLLGESLLIDGREVLQYDFIKHEGFVRLRGTETLNLSTDESPISRVKFVRSNALLDKNYENAVFRQFISFVDRMLMFYSLDINRYRGYKIGRERITNSIISAGKTKDFEAFLRKNNVDLSLVEKDVDGIKELMVHYNYGDVGFYDVASTGTRSLALFYYWFIQMESASFVYMDEFDAFYHFELAKSIVDELKKFTETQIIFTTHNTDLLSNDLLRPDCFFWLNDCSIKSLSQLTEKELRRAHNLQKMFKAGAFHA